MNDHGFRFQHFDIWKRAIAIGGKLHDLAENLDSRGYRRYAEQLRAAAMSISNNIAEGSGSESGKEFATTLTSPTAPPSKPPTSCSSSTASPSSRPPKPISCSTSWNKSAV